MAKEKDLRLRRTRRAKPEERGVLTRYAATTKVKRNAADGLFTKPSRFI